MRQLIFVSLFFSFSGLTNAQVVKVKPPYARPAPSFSQKIRSNNYVFDSTTFRKLSSGNYAVSLKQDNMPCIIPVIENQVMPNGFRGENARLGKIPNAWQKDSVLSKK